MYTNVYVCRAYFPFFGTLFCVLPNSSSPSLRDTGEDVLGVIHSVSTDGFRLQVFLGRERRLFSSCASNAHNVGPLCGRTRGTFSTQAAFRGLVRIRCNCPGSGRPKSTQVDLSRRKSTGFLFFWTFFLISQTVPPADSGSLTRSVPIGCDCLGLGRVATDYVGVFPFCRPLHA